MEETRIGVFPPMMLAIAVVLLSFIMLWEHRPSWFFVLNVEFAAVAAIGFLTLIRSTSSESPGDRKWRLRSSLVLGHCAVWGLYSSCCLIEEIIVMAIATFFIGLFSVGMLVALNMGLSEYSPPEYDPKPAELKKS